MRKPEIVQRFLREMRWLAQLDHSNIVKVFAAGEHDGTPYAALEFVDGRDLARSRGLRDSIVRAASTEGLKYGGITNMMDRLSNPAKIAAFNAAEELKDIMRPLFRKHMDDIISENDPSKRVEQSKTSIALPP